MKRVFKTLGMAILIYLVAQVLLSYLFPNSGIKALLNVVLVGCLLIAIFSLIFGGKGTAFSSIIRTAGLIVGMTVVTIVIALLTASTSSSIESSFDLVTTFIEEVVPFGSYIGTAFGVILKSADAQPLAPAVVIARDSAKLVLEAIIYPILSGFVYVFVFANSAGAHETNASHNRRSYRDFLSFSPIYNKTGRRWSVRGAIAGFFGAVYSAYAATLVFNIGTDFLTSSVGELPTTIITFAQILALLALILVMPLANMGFAIAQPNRVSLLLNLLFSLIKMIVLNVVIVLIVLMFAGTVH
jgi:hypothetical protein